MSPQLKIALYVCLTALALATGLLGGSSYRRLMSGGEGSAPTSASDVPAVETQAQAAAKSSDGYGKVISYGIGFVASIIGLGFLVGHDIAQVLGNRAIKGLYNDEGEGMSDPEYDRAEQEWADGHHLEAIRRMREYLVKNPREQHVALRIAEIYEKDLQNNLAAALEYEEVLTHPLPAERWGWAAIHLCNLYFKLGHTDKAIELLRRIDAEYGETQAAEKARKRLAMYDEEGGASAVDAADTEPPKS
jgi:hypothetical protein